MDEPVKILLDKNQINQLTIKQYYVDVEQDKYKYETLIDLYDTITMAQTFIFCNSKERVEWLSKKLISQNFSVCFIHSGLQ